MPFDAGTIIARLELDPGDFDRQLAARRAAAQRAEREPIKLKATDIFSTQDMSSARKRIADLDNQISRDATTRMRSSNGSVLGTLMALFSPRQVSGAPSPQQAAQQGMLGRVLGAVTPGGGGGGGGNVGFGGGTGGGGNGSFITRLLSGIGPQVLGLGGRATFWTGLGGTALGALPALAGPLGALGLGGAGAGLIAAGAGQLIGSKNVKGQPATQGPLYDQATAAMKSVQAAFKAGAAPLLQPLKQVFSEVPSLIRNVLPAVKDVFAGAATLIQPLVNSLSDLAVMILPLLGKAFRAAAPLIEPLIDGLGKLVAGILPGLTSLLRASAPAVAAFSGVLTTLGKGIGQMLGDFAPAVKASAVILKALGDVLGGLFPIIGQLAGVFARTLAPIIIQFAGVIRALEPVLTIVGHVLASLASAILGDLVSAFGALARLLISIEPSIKIFANALSQAFNVLENSGVFAVLGDTLEKLVPILAKLINTLVSQLAPILPVLITLVSQFSTILIDLLAAGLETILTGVLALVTHFKALVPILAVATAAWWLFNVALDANPIGLVILAAVALVGAITLLVKNWSKVWGEIKSIAADAWNFIWNGFGKYLLPLLGPVGLIALGAIELAKHWHDITSAIASDADSLWQHLVGWGDDIKKLFTITIPGWWDDFVGFTTRDLIDPVKRGFDALTSYIHDNFVLPIENTFTNTIPNAFKTAVRLIGTAWSDIKSAVRGPVAWVIDNVVDGLISAFDWVSGKVGGPHISQVHPMGLAGGGRVPGYGGGDQWPALLESGEVVVPKEKAGPLAWLWKMIGIPGYANGGSPGQTGNPHLPQGQPNPGGGIGGIVHKVLGGIGHGLLSGGKILAALATGNTTALLNAFTGMFPKGVGGAVGDLASLLVDIPKTLAKDAIHSLIGTAQNAYASKFTGKYGPGVAQWRGDVLQALRMEGLPASLAARVLYQMQTESSGNPNAINLTDSNAAAGDPSRGLLQTIMTTFRAYHWPGTSWDIYNPLANIAAAINYALHTYGPTLMRDGMGMGSGHGYALGGPITEPIWGVGKSGRHYTFGERGPEYVTPGGPPGDTSRVEALLAQIITEVRRNATATGAAVGGALNGATRRAFYNSQYQTGGA
jgi:SLT domain-containing protein/phage-related protein